MGFRNMRNIGDSCFKSKHDPEPVRKLVCLADLFLYSYESEFLQKLVKDKKIHEARAFNFKYRYIDDVLSINNSRFAEFLPLIYPPETTDTASSE